MPGWGGTYLLPRLIGPAAALTVIVENPLNQNKMLAPTDRRSRWVSPTHCSTPPTSWRSRCAGRQGVVGAVLIERAGPVPRTGTGARATARLFPDGKLHGAAAGALPGARPGRRGPDHRLDEGFDAEDQANADLLLSDELRAGLYAFDLVQKRAREPAGAPDKSWPAR